MEYILSFPSTPVPPGTEVIIARPSEKPGKFKSIIIPSTIAIDFGVFDISVAGKSLMQGPPDIPVPAVVFSEGAGGLVFRDHYVEKDDPVAFKVKNQSNRTANFTAAAIITVDEQTIPRLKDTDRENILLYKHEIPSGREQLIECEAIAPGRLNRIMLIGNLVNLRIAGVQVDRKDQFIGGIDGDASLPAALFDPSAAYPRFNFDSGKTFGIRLRNMDLEKPATVEAVFLLV